MNKAMKRAFSLMLALSMVLVLLAGCKKEQEVKTGNFTYHAYQEAMANNWNPHTWETNADQLMQDFLTSPFCTMSILDSENGVYQWIYEMATSITDVTKDHTEDLTKYGVSLLEGQKAEDMEDGFVFEIALNPKAKWENGTAITADDYIYSMQQLLNPKMHNMRANLYYSGESAVAGGDKYYYAGSVNKVDNGETGAYTLADLVKGEDGKYTTPDGGAVYIAVNFPIAQCGGDSLKTYVDAYGEQYFDISTWDQVVAKMNEEGLMVLNDENLALFTPVTTGNENWNETEADLPNYFVYEQAYPEVGYDVVGCYKVDEYTIRYVCQNHVALNDFLTSCTSTWLIYKDLYEEGKDTSGKLVTTDYCTSKETTMSYGPYKISELQKDKQIVFVQNENWLGYEKQEDGHLVAMTNFEVDGEARQQYQATKIVIDVMDDAAAKQAFMKGELSEWTPGADDLLAFSTSEQLYKVDETYTMSFFFNSGLDNLKTMDASKGNKNSVVLSNDNFRKAMSLAIDRAQYVTATPGYKPAYALMNNLYYYDIYNDPTSSYRGSEEAMQAICNLYGVEYGSGKAYKDLKEAYQSINGYNLTEAKALMKTACDELKAAGLYKEGEDILIRIAWSKGPLNSSDNKCVELVNQFINEALEGSGFGRITFQAVDNIDNRYDDVANGEYAIGYGAWGGAALYPFRNFRVYFDPDYQGINEAGCWDPKKETLTLKVKDEDVTLTWQEWSNALTAGGRYDTLTNKEKLGLTAQLEELYLQKYYRIPLCGSTNCTMMAYQVGYYTDNYNLMYDFGGFRLMRFNYTDEEWTKYVAEQGGRLSYE